MEHLRTFTYCSSQYDRPIRFAHPDWFTRYVWGFFASVQVMNFFAENSYGIPKNRDQNVKWGYWMDFCHKKRMGEIERSMPGYMYMKWVNDTEKRWWESHGREYAGFELPN